MPRLTPFRSHRRRAARGYTLLEALLLVTVLGITSSGVGAFLVTVQDNTEGGSNMSLIDSSLVSQMETLRATWQTRGIGVLTSNVTVGNTTYVMTTDVEQASPNGGAAQSTFYSLSVQIAGRTVYSYVSH